MFSKQLNVTFYLFFLLHGGLGIIAKIRPDPEHTGIFGILHLAYRHTVLWVLECSNILLENLQPSLMQLVTAKSKSLLLVNVLLQNHVALIFSLQDFGTNN